MGCEVVLRGSLLVHQARLACLVAEFVGCPLGSLPFFAFSNFLCVIGVASPVASSPEESYYLLDRTAAADVVLCGLLHASGTWTMNGETKKETPGTTTTDDEDHNADEEKIKRSSAAAHAVNDDEVTNDEPHDPDSKPEEDAIEAIPQGSREQEQSNQNADSNPNPSVDSVPQDELEDELEPWLGYIVCATHKAEDLLAQRGSRRGSTEGEQDVLKASKNDCQTLRRPLDKTHLQMEPNDVTPTDKGSRKQGRPPKRWEDDINLYVTPARDGLKWDALESDFLSIRLKRPKKPTSPIVTTKAHDHDHDHDHKSLLHDANNSPLRELSKAHALWPSAQVRALCTESWLDE